MAVRLFIICDVRLYRDGLDQCLRRQSWLDVTGTDVSGPNALERVHQLRPDVVLVDIAASAGRDMIAMLRDRAPTTPVVAIGLDAASEAVLACVAAGASACVTREASVQDLAVALARSGFAASSVRWHERGGSGWIDRRAERGVHLRNNGTRAPCDTRPVLTRRQREILSLIEHGLSNKEIAHLLRVKLPTVKNHVHHILEKLGVSRRGAAAALARAERRAGPGA